MNHLTQLECRASSSLGKHEGESSFALCDRLNRTRVNSQRQLPTDHDYAVPTREYQTDQSSLKSAQAAARSTLEKQHKQRHKQPIGSAGLTRSLHIRANALIEPTDVSAITSEKRVDEDRSCSAWNERLHLETKDRLITHATIGDT